MLRRFFEFLAGFFRFDSHKDMALQPIPVRVLPRKYRRKRI